MSTGKPPAWNGQLGCSMDAVRRDCLAPSRSSTSPRELPGSRRRSWRRTCAMNAAAAWWISVGNQNEAGTKIYRNKNMGNNISVISHEKAGEQENIVRFQGDSFPNFPTLGMVDVKKNNSSGSKVPAFQFQPSTAPRRVRF